MLKAERMKASRAAEGAVEGADPHPLHLGLAVLGDDHCYTTDLSSIA
jgi:hypothetical protein